MLKVGILDDSSARETVAEITGGKTEIPFKYPAEVSDLLKSALGGNFRDIQGGFIKKVIGPFQAEFGQML